MGNRKQNIKQIIEDWVRANFGDSEAEDPSWNIESLSKHIDEHICPYEAVCRVEIDNSCDAFEHDFTEDEKQQMAKELYEHNWAETLKESADDIVSDLLNKKEVEGAK
jgi:hypothetical protein